jgi:hypothetical protein
MTLFDSSSFYVVAAVYENGWLVATAEQAAEAFLHGRRVRLVTADELKGLT